VICATKKPLLDLVRAGRFRDDLYYRINSVVIELPPLRRRPDDILPLAHHFLRELGACARDDTPTFTEAARQALLAYDWPGNVRQLKHALEHAVTFARGRAIDRDHLPSELSTCCRGSRVQLNLHGPEPISLPEILADCERQLIEWALAQSGGNQVQAAKLLGLSRTTFRGRLESVAGTGHPDGGG
jgi:DNA-binding NtrC family response regulator